jgi:hypothetical protein
LSKGRKKQEEDEEEGEECERRVVTFQFKNKTAPLGSLGDKPLQQQPHLTTTAHLKTAVLTGPF